MSRRHTLRRAGLTLVEVMIALAILGMALVMLVKSVATNAIAASGVGVLHGRRRPTWRGARCTTSRRSSWPRASRRACWRRRATSPTRAIPRITWKATIEPAELPSYEKLVALSANGGPGGGSGSGAEAVRARASARRQVRLERAGRHDEHVRRRPGRRRRRLGAGGRRPAASSPAQYALIQGVLKASVRKITLDGEVVDRGRRRAGRLHPVHHRSRRDAEGAADMSAARTPRRDRRRPATRGMTLIEILIAMAILGLMMTLAWSTHQGRVGRPGVVRPRWRIATTRSGWRWPAWSPISRAPTCRRLRGSQVLDNKRTHLRRQGGGGPLLVARPRDACGPTATSRTRR
jgi:prepilin-type N-terminal cleavage/methylation domain-containing protein